MIDKIEIDAKAKEFEINSSNVQRDYIFGWLLSGIYSESSLGEDLILKGGNALRKIYYPGTRFSKDLDFSVQSEANPEVLKRELNKLCAFVGEKTGVEFKTDETRIERTDKLRGKEFENTQIYEARLYFKSFYGEEEIVLKVQLDITSLDTAILPVQQKKLIHPYSDFDICTTDVRAHKLEEILATKLITLLHRRKASDIFDFANAVFVNKQSDVNRLEIVKTFLKKSLQESKPDVAKQELVSVPIEEYRSGWENLTVPVSGLFSFDKVVAEFRGAIDSLFALLPTTTTRPSFARARISRGFSGGSGRIQGATVAPHNARGTIISGGQSRTLIEIVYDGFRRLVEPYALEYRIRKRDGRGMEYLWAWDTSGGKSGHIGIKMFIYNKIQSTSSTNMQYQPRFEVEF